MRKVKVSFVTERWAPVGFDNSVTGILFKDNHVVAVDEFGAVAIYKCSPTNDPNVVVVDYDNDDGRDLLEDNPDLFFNLILTGGVK